MSKLDKWGLAIILLIFFWWIILPAMAWEFLQDIYNSGPKLFFKQWRCNHENYKTVFQDEHYSDIRRDKCLDCGLEYRAEVPGSTARLLSHMAGGSYKNPSRADIARMRPRR